MAQAIVPATTETFNDIPIHIYEHEGKKWIAGSDLGRAIGLGNPRTGMSLIFTRHKDELVPHTTDFILKSVDGKSRKHKAYDEPGAYLVTMFANTDRAKEVRLWLANLPRLLREQQPQPALPSSPSLSTVADRRPLIEACNLLTKTRYLPKPVKKDYAEVRANVSAFLGVERWEDIRREDLPKALEFIQVQINTALMRNASPMPVRLETMPEPLTDLEIAARKIKGVGRSLNEAMGEFHTTRCRNVKLRLETKDFMLGRGETYLSESMDRMLNVMGEVMQVLENMAKSARYLASV